MKKSIKKQIIIDIIIIAVIIIFWQVRSMQKERAAELVEGTVELHVIDVGQGDSVLIKTAVGNLLIDAGTGESEAALAKYLDSVGVDSFEYCIFTHPHEDHIGGADMIIDNYDVRNVIMSPASADSAAFDRLLDALERSEANVIEAVPDSKYYIGDLEIFIMGPIAVGDDRDLNNTSVITRLSYGGVRMLFTGDAEKTEEQDILDKYSIFELDCDFLKIGHHGSSTSSGDGLMNAVTPYIAAVSCGKDNSYGHPHREIIAMLNERGIEYQRTDELGDLVYICDGKTIEFKD